LENRRAGYGAGIGTSGREKDVGKGYEKVKIGQILCTQVYKWKK
jgi:hypothetical protein